MRLTPDNTAGDAVHLFFLISCCRMTGESGFKVYPASRYPPWPTFQLHIPFQQFAVYLRFSNEVQRALQDHVLLA